MDRKTVMAMFLVMAAVAAVAASYMLNRPLSQAQEVALLQQQRAAMGLAPRQMQAPMLDDAARHLSLTPAQKERVGAVQRETMPRVQQILQNNSLSMEQKRDRMEQVQKDQATRIKALLSPQQQNRYDEIRQRMGFPRGGMGGPPPEGVSPQGSGGH